MFGKPTSAKSSADALRLRRERGICFKRALSLSLLLVAILTLTGCASSGQKLLPAAPNTLRIISSLPTKGQLASQSVQIRQAIDLAITQRKSIAGRLRVEHVALDDGSDETGEWAADKEQANAREAAADSSVVAYIGPYNSGAAALSLPATNSVNLLQLGPTTTWPGLTLDGWNPGEPQMYYPTGRRNFARLMPPDSLQATAAARWAAQSGVRSVYLLQDGSSYSDGLSRAFAAEAKSLKLAIKGETLVVPGQTGLAEKIATSGSDALFYAPSSAANAVAAAKGLQKVNLPGGIYSSDTAMSDQFLAGAPSGGPQWHIVHNSLPSPPQTPQWKAFSLAFQQVYRDTPGQFAANAYDLTNLVLDAIQKAGADRGKIMQVVMSTRAYSGVTGEITFDTNGDIEQWQMSGYSVVGGRFSLSTLLRSSK